MTTYQDILGDTIPAHLEAQAEIPVLAGLQRQGDLIIIPRNIPMPTTAHIPTDGIPIIRGENGGNTHLLIGDAHWAPNTAGNQSLGLMSVASTAYLVHPEHGAQGFAPGVYEIRRQREQADQIRLVAD